MKRFIFRVLRVLFGLFLYALGSCFVIQANVGLGAWEAFSVGVSNITGLSIGDVVVVTGLFILVIDVLLREKIGVGTVLNTILIGKILDLLLWLGLIPKMTGFFDGLAVLLLGQVVICLGTFFYVGAGLGAGPRDSLMVAVGKRVSAVPIGAVRGMLEGAVLLLGWALGAKVGVGTVISVFGISFIMQATFHVLRFDVKAVKHESLLQTARVLARGNKM